MKSIKQILCFFMIKKKKIPRITGDGMNVFLKVISIELKMLKKWSL